MEIPHLDEHQELALALYQQRQGLLKLTWSDAVLLASVEHRMRTHVFALSHYIDDEEKEPSKEHEIFVYLARRILSSNEENSEKAWQQALEWLLEGGDKEQGAMSAFVLLPPFDKHGDILLDAFNETEELQPFILKVWTKTQATVDEKIVRRADLLSAPKELQISILEYAGRLEDYQLDFFQSFYMPLVNGRGETHLHLLEASIFAGLMRADPNAKIALLRGIEQFPKTAEQLRLLRLAALTGDNELVSILKSMAESTPAIAYYLLAIHGNKAAVPAMIEGLKQANKIEHAERGWDLLTDVKLPKIPRMYLAADDSDEDSDEDEDSFDIDEDDEIFELDDELTDDSDETDMVPDVMLAEEWWEENKTVWLEQNRYFKGQTAGSQGLAKLVIKAAGTAMLDLLDALAIELKTPLADYSNSWVTQRNEFLEKYAQGGSDSDASSDKALKKSQQQNSRSAQDSSRSAQEKNYARAR